MKKIHWILFVIALVMIGSTATFLFQIKGHQKLGNPGVKLGNAPLFDVNTNRIADVSVILPENVLGYMSMPVPISAIELEMLPKDTTFGRRRYWMTNDANVDLAVVLMGKDRTSIHKPELCLVGQGWTIDESEMVPIKMEQPYPYDLSVIKMTASIRIKDDQGNPVTVRGIYVFWFVAENKLTANHNERMWSMMTGLLRTGTLERWAYVSCFSRCFPGREEETFNRLKQFIAASTPQFQLTAGKPLRVSSQTNLQTAFK